MKLYNFTFEMIQKLKFILNLMIKLNWSFIIQMI